MYDKLSLRILVPKVSSYSIPTLYRAHKRAVDLEKLRAFRGPLYVLKFFRVIQPVLVGSNSLRGSLKNLVSPI